MTVVEAFRKLTGKLIALYDKREAENITDMVIEKITGLRRMERILKKEIELTVQQEKELEHYLSELLQHKPVQYVLQEAWFYGLPFFVNEHVLIPRPETEELVEWIITGVKSHSHPPFTILDIGTGSGCIPVALKKQLDASVVTAIDVSGQALGVAKKNADNNNVSIDFLLVDALNETQLNTLPVFDIIVSNPPYIPLTDMADMQENVLNYEPHTALFVPDEDPLLFYKAIAKFASSHLNNAGKVYVEIHEAQGEAAKKIFEKNGFTNCMIKKDMQGKDRMLRAGIGSSEQEMVADE
ncbi:MAG: peptide chain release factor N(5)-glutamine methyltransferase [Agriterribacter sp.]